MHSLRRVQARVRSGRYASYQPFERDMLLIFRNAFEYNLPGSQIYADAETLLQEFLHGQRKITFEDAQTYFNKAKLTWHGAVARIPIAIVVPRPEVIPRGTEQWLLHIHVCLHSLHISSYDFMS